MFLILVSFLSFSHLTIAQESDLVADSLNGLGVNTSVGTRFDDNGNIIPDSYSPLGQTYTPNERVELAIMGVELDNTTPRMAIVDDLGDGGATLMTREDTPFLESNVRSRGHPNTRRNAIAGDTDGDGQDELIAAYMRDQEVVLRVFDDAATGFSEADYVIALAQDVQDIQLATGDINADGREEVILAMSYSNRGEIMIAGNMNGTFTQLQSAFQPITGSLQNATISMEVVTGNVDYDTASEIAIVFNETLDDSEGIAQYFIYDDSSMNYTPINSGIVQGIFNGIKSAVIGTVALGDIDGDGLDEIVLAGLTNRENQCDTNGHLLVAFDDAMSRFASIGTWYDDVFMRGCPSFSAWRLRYLHLNTFDVDGDFIDEISANQFVFDDFQREVPFTILHEIPVEDNLIEVNNFGWWDRSTSDFAVGDFTGDGRENLLIYMQNRDTVDIWGVDTTSTWTRLHEIPVQFYNAQNPIVPLLIPLNTDKDSPVLQYTESEYQLVFTEPIIIAVLAAAPCGTGQDTGNCTTIFGSETSSSVESETSVTITASLSVGVQIDGGAITQSEFELKDTLTGYATATIGTAATRTDTITFATGPLEDTVIFTSVPVDRYTYRVVSHPNPVMINSTVTVDLPRDPVTIMVERDFFNANVQGDTIQINERIFQHQVGNPDSYPNRGQKQQLLSQYSGFESTLQNVGQGTGTRSVEIAIGREVSSGRTIGVNYTREVNATAGGILGGFSVGFGEESSLRLAYGEATIYGGTVGNIDADNFAANAYSFGLFSYVYTDPDSGQQFQVLNYWVE